MLFSSLTEMSVFYKYSQGEVDDTGKAVKKSRTLKKKLLLNDKEKGGDKAVLFADGEAKEFSDKQLAFYFSQFSKDQLLSVSNDVVDKQFRKEFPKRRINDMSKEQIVGLYVNMSLDRDCKGVENEDFVVQEEGDEQDEEEQETEKQEGGGEKDKKTATKKRVTLDLDDDDLEEEDEGREEILNKLQMLKAQQASLEALLHGSSVNVTDVTIMQVTEDAVLQKRVDAMIPPANEEWHSDLRSFLFKPNASGEQNRLKQWERLRKQLFNIFKLEATQSWPEEVVKELIAPIMADVKRMYVTASVGFEAAKLLDNNKKPWMLEADELIAAEAKLKKKADKAKSDLGGQQKKKQKFGGGGGGNNNRFTRNDNYRNNGNRQFNNNAGGGNNNARGGGNNNSNRPVCPNCDRVNPSHTPEDCFVFSNPRYAARVQANRAEGKPGFSYRQ